MNIIVAGGTRGIGREVVRILAKDDNNNIIIIGRNDDSLRILESEHSNILPVKLDLSVPKEIESTIRSHVAHRFKSIDILINMAGLLINKKFNDMTDEEGRLVLQTNFLGPASLIRSISHLLRKGSHIINISSMGGFQGSSKYEGLSYYSASKAALACLTECLAGEYRDQGITVNCLALGSVQTEMLEEAFPGYKAPLDAEKMADFICWFALNGNSYFNGKILPVAVSNP
jgi:3-oxoacyl-[acyl-carrier protein] reductase